MVKRNPASSPLLRLGTMLTLLPLLAACSGSSLAIGDGRNDGGGSDDGGSGSSSGGGSTSSSGGGGCAAGIVPGCTSTTNCPDPSGCGGWTCSGGQWLGNDVGLACSPGTCPDAPPNNAGSCAAPGLICEWPSSSGPWGCVCEAAMGGAPTWNCGPVATDGGADADAQVD